MVRHCNIAAVAPRIARHTCGKGNVVRRGGETFSCEAIDERRPIVTCRFPRCGRATANSAREGNRAGGGRQADGNRSYRRFSIFEQRADVVDSTTVSRLIGPSVPLPNEGGH